MAISTQEREISGFRECGSGLHIWPPELLFQKFIQGIVGRCFSSNHALKVWFRKYFSGVVGDALAR
jgi:hypothetical protein